MIPILFNSSATTFATNGIGRLSDARSCVVTEERNGPYTMTMEYPINGVHFSDIRHSNIIVAQPFQGGGLQPFRISRVSRPIKGIVKVDAEHISYQLNHIPVMPFSAQGVANALNGFKTSAAEACPFSFWTDLTSTSSFAVPLPSTIRSYLGGRKGSIIDVYGGGAEYEWDVYTVKLHNARGKDKGVTLRYGKNITDLTQEENIENTYTGICPYWTSTEGELVTLPEKVIHSANASNFPYQRTIPYDFSDVFDNTPTVAQLREYTQRFITKNNIGVPNVNIKVKFINLADTAEYKDTLKSLQTVNLCDTVTVVFEKLGVSTKSKVVQTDWDVLNDRYLSIEIGDKRSSLSTTIEDQMEKVDAAPTTAQMQASIDRATGVLGAGLRGHVVINRNQEGYANEILFLDTQNLYTAKNVLRINMSGIGFSSTGYRGPYSQSWTIDGHFGLGGVNNASGDFTIYDSQTPNPKKLGEWNNQGLQFFDSAENILLKVNHGGLYLYNAAKQVLAQLTASGLNIYTGYIKLGKNFEVKQDGTMTATGANFSGQISASKIDIGKNFHVDLDGNLTANNGKFTGGEITNGQNFKIDKDGNVTIRKGTIKIGNNFNVDELGNLTARNGVFNGGEITIKGKRGDVFKTGIDEDGYQTVSIGGFRVWEAGEGAYLGSADQEVFIGDNEDMCFVTGWDGESYAHGNPKDNLNNSKFGVVIDSDNVYAQEVYINNNIFDGNHYWGVGETINDIYEGGSDGNAGLYDLTSRVEDLEHRIANLGGGE